VGSQGGAADDRTLLAELRATADELDRVFESGLVGMAICDFDGRFVRVNVAFARMHGHDAGWFPGRGISEIRHRADRRTDILQLGMIRQGRHPGTIRAERFLHADGRTIWGDALVHVIPAPDGRPRHFLLQVRDITHELEAEAELARQRQRLDASQAAAHVGTW
jgi:PAS domain S-box-containing protein